MSGSGKRQLVINTQERAISPDINRLQAFAARDDAELFRYFFDVQANDDLDAGAVLTEPSTLLDPLRCEIVNGLLVRPQTGSLNLLVDPGVAYAVAPDGAADSSNYKYVRDPGVTVLGSLVLTAGAGSTRIDVIECRVNPVDDIVTDNRDIFDPTTGLFTAQSVTKERAARFEYRVRDGVAGAGFPGTALGWMPLCVASVPAGAPDVDTVTFWDVRPLMNSRVYQPFSMSNDRPHHKPYNMVDATALATTTGLVEVDFNGRRGGGRLRSGTVGDAESIDLTSADNQEPGIAFTASRPWYLYLFLPYGLSRWARYTAAGTRLPRSPRGIPVVSMTAPDTDGRPTSGITPPTVTGLVTASSNAVCVASGWNTPGGAQAGFAGENAGGFMYASAAATAQPFEVASAPTLSPGAPNTGLFLYTLTAGTDFPVNARSLFVEGRALILTGALGNVILDVAVFVSNTLTQFGVATAITFGGNTSGVFFRQATWVELPVRYPVTTGYTVTIAYLVTDNGGTPWVAPSVSAGSDKLRVLGYKL